MTDSASGHRPDEALALSEDGVREVPTWFGPDDRPLFGWFTLPVDGRVRGAVVLCQPMGEEGDKTYRTFRTLARRLAQAGLLALRFDYDGTGDSAGGFDDPDRVNAWIDSVERAVAEVRSAGATQVSLVGMRLGGTIAYAAAQRGLALASLVLWDPCASGRAFLREQQLLLRSASLGVAEADPTHWIESPSYRYPVHAAADLRTLAIDGQRPVAALAENVTVLVRADVTPARSLSEALPRDGSSWSEVSGQDLLLDRSILEAVVPYDGVEEVVSRLSATASDVWGEVRPRQTLSATWWDAGRRVTETARLVGPHGELFGIETRAPGHDPALPRVLAINVALERHVGPGRMWVRLAREIAGEGFVSLRMDQSGVGDSATPQGSHEDVVFADRWLDDVPMVARGLAGEAGVVGVGICSSGVSVLQAAEKGALREAVCVNVVLRRSHSFPFPWTSRRWTAFSRMPRRLDRLSVRHVRIARALWSAMNVFAPWRSPLWLPRRVVRRGGRLTFLMGPGEQGEIVETWAWRSLWGRPLRRRPGFRAEALGNADHSLRSGRGQDDTIEAIRQRLRSYRPQAEGRGAREAAKSGVAAVADEGTEGPERRSESAAVAVNGRTDTR